MFKGTAGHTHWHKYVALALTALVVVLIAVTLIGAWIETRLEVRLEAEQQRVDQDLNTVHQWPTIQPDAAPGVTATLRTVCRTAAVGLAGKFQYELRVWPTDSAMALIARPSAPAPEFAQREPEIEVREVPSDDEWQERLRHREESYSRMRRQDALSIVIHTQQAHFVIEFLDADGFRTHEIVVPTDSLVEETARSGRSSALVANRLAATTCGPDVLSFSSWRLRVEP